MSRKLSHFLKRKLNEYRRNSNTFLIIYKCRYKGITRTNFKKKRTTCRKEFSKRDSCENHEDLANTNCNEKFEVSEEENKDILDTILKTWSSTLETDLTDFFEEKPDKISNYSSDTSISCSSSETLTSFSFPFHNPSKIEPVFYWNYKADNMKQALGNCCACRKKKKPKKSCLHLDAISRMKLQSFIKSLCDDECNTEFCQPEENSYQENCCKTKRLKRKGKLKCKCKNDSSMVSFHITVPKQTKSIILTNESKTTNNIEQQNRQATVDTNYNTENCMKCCLNKNTIRNQSSMTEPGDITLNLGSQTISIRVNRENDIFSSQYNATTQKQQKCPGCCPESCGTENQNVNSKYLSKNGITYSSFPKINNTQDETCECLDKIKQNLENDLKNLLLYQLIQRDKQTNKTFKPSKCKFFTQKLRNREQEQESRISCNPKCEGIQPEKMKCSPNCKFSENYDQDEEQNDYYDERKYIKERKGKICEHNECPWREKRYAGSKKISENKKPEKASLKCFCDQIINSTDRDKVDKCCSCSNNHIKEQKKKCECSKSKKRPPRREDKCCQCEPKDQNGGTQVDEKRNEFGEPKEVEEMEETADENDPAQITSITEVSSDSVENRRISYSTTNQETAAELQDENCSCCVCDTEYSDEETSSYNDETFYQQEERMSQRPLICDCESEEIRKKYKTKRADRKPNHILSDEREQSRYKRSTSRKNKQNAISRTELSECDCAEFDQLVAELEEYCRNRCVDFKVVQNVQNSMLRIPDQKYLSRMTTQNQSVFIVQKDENKTKPYSHAASFDSEKTMEQDYATKTTGRGNFFGLNQGNFIFRSTDNIKSRSPRKISSKLLDQRAARKRKIGYHLRQLQKEDKI